MKRHFLKVKETMATIIADEKFIPIAEAEIIHERGLLENYIREDLQFRTTLKPYPVRPNAPEIVRAMAEAGARAGVGPMAAVAGAIAEFSLKAMIEAGATHAIVDNGGDMAMILSQPVTVGIFTGPAKIKDIGFKFEPQPGIIGLCTSSGTVGHSLSFGRADAATVISRDVCLADAMATALGNAIKSKNSRRIEEAMNSLWIEGIEGMMVIIDDVIGLCGNLPEIVKIRMDIEKISKGKLEEK